MIHQENQTIRMTKFERKKVWIVSLLFLFICVLQLIDNSPRIRALSESGVKIPYPFYDKACKCANLQPTEKYYRKIDWYTQDLADVLIPVVLMIVIAMHPKLGGLEYMWLFYFVLIMIDRQLTIGKIPFAFWMEIFVCSVQAVYCYTRKVTD